MSSHARVKSIEALRSFRSALLKFKSDMQSCLLAADNEIRRTREWLEERLHYWQKQLQIRRQRLEEAQRALQQCLATVYSDGRGHAYRPDCSQYQVAVAQAMQAVRHAEQELAVVIKCRRQVEEAMQRYQRSNYAFSNMLQGDLVRGTDLLQECVRILSQYAGGVLAGAAAGMIGGVVAVKRGPSGEAGYVAIPAQFPDAHNNDIGTSSGFYGSDMLDDHSRHISSVGASSLNDYQQRAIAFLSGPPQAGTLQLKRTNGDIVRWDPVTGHFGVVSASGVIRTYYNIAQRANPLDYFLRQYW